MASERLGTAHSNWLASLRTTYSTELERREKEDENKENLIDPLVNTVDKVHWYIKENAKQHHTIKFDQIHDQNKPQPVLRRGQFFSLAMRFRDRDVDFNTDRIVLNFIFGTSPSVTKGTMGVILLQNKTFTKSKENWDAKIDEGTKGKDVVLQVFIPPSAPVGIWRLEIKSGLQNQTARSAMASYVDNTDVFILFNPWCKEDLVYLEQESLREEYVMNDKGKVYVGAHRKPNGRAWAYGQFDYVTLPVACYILELDDLLHSERGNPTNVVRAISFGVNETKGKGILKGRWDGEYSDGVAPFKWTGSVRILEEFMKKGFKPVKYGQCWVFSAVTTTICRSLGIPCRSVTNYVSAHDTNSSLTVDKFFDENGEEVHGGPEGNIEDSIWNFHVWNDVWMARPDLPKGYGGWQAIDSTPQEASDSKYQCGPASLEAIRRGDISLAYDCPFVFAEVNADVMHWGEDKKSPWGWSRMKMNQYEIGKCIMTKKPGAEDDFGENDKDDVTGEYKNLEGSEAERLAVHNAIRGSKRAQQYYEFKDDVTEDVEFDLIEIDTIFVGDPFKVKVVIKNKGNEVRTVSVSLTARSIYYTGVSHSLIKKAEGKITLQSQKEQDVALTISYNEYWKLLQEQCMIKMYVICRVQETGQTWTDEDDFQVEKPPMEIKAPSTVKRGTESEFIFSFKNPLDEDLTDCTLNIDGSGLLKPRAITIPGIVPAHEDFIYNFRFRPRIQGERQIIVNFNSKQLYEIRGSLTINVDKE